MVPSWGTSKVGAADDTAESLYSEMFEKSVAGMFRMTINGIFLQANDALRGMYCDSDAVATYTRFGAAPNDYAEFQRRLDEDGSVLDFELPVRRHDGSRMFLLINARAVRGKDQLIRYYEGTVTNTTERRSLQLQLHHAQRMETLGRLAEFIAHDFNNVLGIITGYCDVLKINKLLDGELAEPVNEIYAAARRAASLVQQLLAFGSKELLQPAVLDVNEVVGNLSKMMRRLLGHNIQLVLDLHSDRSFIFADQGQVEQVLLNLIINCHDAMPQGGQVVLSTTVLTIEPTRSVEREPLHPGRYVAIGIEHNGSSLDDTALEHIFEPLYTTNGAPGTGLGLSIVQEIVKSYGGYVRASNGHGHETIFTIYLPFRPEERLTSTFPPMQRLRGSETVLLAEDDSNLRMLTAGYLRALGYTVIEAENGCQAITFLDASGQAIQALITDLVMPQMDGRELAARLVEKCSSLTILYMTGYTHHVTGQTRVLRDKEHVLQKPFSLSELSHKLRQALDHNLQSV